MKIAPEHFALSTRLSPGRASSVAIRPRRIRSTANFDSFLEHNELELALDEIEGVGEQFSPPAEFWLALAAAATQMELIERATQLIRRAA
jgi:hypothetical protein